MSVWISHHERSTGSVLVLSDGLIINEVNYELDRGVVRDNREILR